MHTLLDTENFVISSNFHEDKKRCTMIFRRLFQKVNVTIDGDAEQRRNNIRGATVEYEVGLKKMSRQLDECQRYMDYLETTVGGDLARTKTLLEHQENVIRNITGEIDQLIINTELAMQESRRRNGAL
ncbi:hypothetical protein JTB14_029181 [Gonioctena quinquepunctata]|nr:hypothetical protein JTB14_029181 [Gonioctena quinquepunctata]